MINGWFIGNFSPSVLKTRDFEVAVKHHKAWEPYVPHVHKETTEYNYLVSGKMLIQDTKLVPGDIFVISPFEMSDPVFIEDCVVVVVRTPSIPGDKYEYILQTK